jgi:hypothetical protein
MYFSTPNYTFHIALKMTNFLNILKRLCQEKKTTSKTENVMFMFTSPLVTNFIYKVEAFLAWVWENLAFADRLSVLYSWQRFFSTSHFYQTRFTNIQQLISLKFQEKEPGVNYLMDFKIVALILLGCIIASSAQGYHYGESRLQF